ncbi:phosphatidylinositol N-acetylglucosaminyltransferase [Histoplasma capsulatum var. duboisii H88]|uniref:Phosphatidylinositol N-acetylglucosaminyltransferase n=2 Tax=Ajellomyces capsulatus TaxID=5037 RepID=F0UDM1_AJEC8|nr:phosphatidylinositol N-acetylglucosaminyltransferase [Histoplasma capsulatum H143]EGC43552.1 phosphatidylinositol N-acetylglucosaminyltransferase [Histoplasma capsulatum var. duboisii H88]QSS49715.1 phosphatidylinositol N-acetylglucosaminyltransferase [Histoplasma capsulatum var. duboisii H88]
MPVRLSIQRPSPTTALFTASNASVRSTITSKALFSIEIVLRILLFAVVLLLNGALIRDYILTLDDGIIHWDAVWSSAIGALACRMADWQGWQFTCPVSAVLVYIIFRRGYTEESLLVIRGLGVQTSTSSATYLSKASTRFIPTTQIQDIVIHEAFKGFEVKFYLAIIVEGESNVVVVFPNLLPRRSILEAVWKGARKCLYDLN